MYMPQQKIKMMKKRINSIWNLKPSTVDAPSVILKWCLGTLMQKWVEKKVRIPMQGERDCMRDLMKMGINWYSFLLTTDMIIGGTIFTHKNVHKATSLDGTTMNQIDHVLIKKKTFL